MSDDNDFSTQYAIRLPDGKLFTSPHNGAVWTWSEFAGAEHVWEQLRDHAAAMGIADWAGVIVHRYCTPFIGPKDPAEHMVSELTTWLQQQAGGGS